MIPIKKLKKEILIECNKALVEIEIIVHSLRIQNKIQGHYLNIPWGLDSGCIATIRWNTRRSRFDKITFKAFGKLHKIKL